MGTSQRTARAAVLTAYGQPLEMRELPIPEPEPRALVVRVASATICGSDVHIWEGSLANVLHIDLPVILGHEVVGEIVAIGEGAEIDSVGQALKVGDRVVWAHESCGHCYQCTILHAPSVCHTRRVGMLQNCERFPYFGGSFSEYSYVWPKSGRVRVPDELKSEWASAASCALRTVVNVFEKAGKIGHMDSVVIQGAGPLGLFATAMASACSPREVIVIGAPEARLEIARQWGATQTISIDDFPSAADRLARVREITDGAGAAVAMELSGGRTAFGEGVEMVADGGRYIIAGTVGGDPQPVRANLITNRELNVHGVYGADIDAYHKALEFMRQHRDRFDWDLMLGNRYRLDELTLALQKMQAYQDIKPVVVTH